MRVPKQFKLAGVTWTVELVPKLTNYGNTIYEEYKMELRKGMKKELKEVTFCHELVHAIKYSMGELNHNEKHTDAFAQLLHQALTTME